MADYTLTHTGAQLDEAAALALDPDTTPTANSQNLITSGAVAAADAALSGRIDGVSEDVAALISVISTDQTDGALFEAINTAITAGRTVFLSMPVTPGGSNIPYTRMLALNRRESDTGWISYTFSAVAENAMVYLVISRRTTSGLTYYRQDATQAIQTELPAPPSGTGPWRLQAWRTGSGTVYYDWAADS